jgi:hypothetical protein
MRNIFVIDLDRFDFGHKPLLIGANQNDTQAVEQRRGATGANAGASSQISGVDLDLPLRRRGCGAGFASDPSAGAEPPPSSSKAPASRRHPNNCCGLSPWRRATSDTLTPPARLSTTMRALSSLDHRRRRPMPVISSIRRTSETPPPAPAALLPSLRSSVMSKSSLMDRHYATTRTPPKRGNEAPLSLNRQDGDQAAALGGRACPAIAMLLKESGRKRQRGCLDVHATGGRLGCNLGED